jgi:hypothetical protein
MEGFILHTPKGMMLTIGALSAAVTAIFPCIDTTVFDVTCNWLGVAPIVH